MLFNSFQFLWLFPLVFIAYYLINRIGGVIGRVAE